MPLKFARLDEVRSLIAHGLGENAHAHEEYIAEFRQVARDVEKMYDGWLLSTGRREPRTTSRDRSNPARVETFAGRPALEPIPEL